ncbi:MAG: DNA alkylation repair protein [bacterium]|nr:DNA alkylation repair protein [bacterium]
MVTLKQVRARLRGHADPQHAIYHKAYHKSSLDFYGLRAPQLHAAFRDLFPAKQQMDREDALKLVGELRSTGWAEEGSIATMLLARIQPQLTAADVPYLSDWCDRCNGWGEIDTVCLEVIGPLALRLGTPVYRQVRAWSKAEHMWTRRAAILVHIIPARRYQLSAEYSWPTFEELLYEREFFIRKAIGWTLRECSKNYPELVADFLLRVGDSASGLTRREGGRNLPEELRARVLPGYATKI